MMALIPLQSQHPFFFLSLPRRYLLNRSLKPNFFLPRPPPPHNFFRNRPMSFLAFFPQNPRCEFIEFCDFSPTLRRWGRGFWTHLPFFFCLFPQPTVFVPRFFPTSFFFLLDVHLEPRPLLVPNQTTCDKKPSGPPFFLSDTSSFQGLLIETRSISPCVLRRVGFGTPPFPPSHIRFPSFFLGTATCSFFPFILLRWLFYLRYPPPQLGGGLPSVSVLGGGGGGFWFFPFPFWTTPDIVRRACHASSAQRLSLKPLPPSLAAEL